MITGNCASGKSQVNSDWTEMFVKAGADVLKAIRSGHDETNKWKDNGVNQTGTPNAVATNNSTLNDDPYSIYKNDISKDKQKVVKLGIGIAPGPIRFVPEDSSEEYIDNVKKQMIEADNEVSRKLGFRVNKNDCKKDTKADDSTCAVSNPVTIDFDGAGFLKAVQNVFDGTSNCKDNGINQIGTPNAVTTSYSTFDDNKGTNEKESFCISPNPFDQN